MARQASDAHIQEAAKDQSHQRHEEHRESRESLEERIYALHPP
jgi:hypothetical protein